jgi:uncharacterized damage-inducible protein DinB
MSQTTLLADQIRRAFEGPAWHGDPVLTILNGINARQAAAHPVKKAHSIWELVLHIAAWDGAVLRRTGGLATNLSPRQNFPPIPDSSEKAWREAVEHMKRTHGQLVEAVAAFPDSRLQEQVPGKKEKYYNFYFMFSGIVQHELYHAGQIAVLKKSFEKK